MKVNLSLYCEKTFCFHNIWCAQNKNYATMGVWERMPLRSHSLFLFPPKPRRLPGYIRRTSASAHTSGPEGRALHAAKHCPLRALNEACSKGQGADCGKTLYRGLTVPNYAPEKGKGHPPVMEAEAAAAMTCPGAIPLKTAMCACIRVCQYGVTI